MIFLLYIPSFDRTTFYSYSLIFLRFFFHIYRYIFLLFFTIQHILFDSRSNSPSTFHILSSYLLKNRLFFIIQHTLFDSRITTFDQILKFSVRLSLSIETTLLSYLLKNRQTDPPPSIFDAKRYLERKKLSKKKKKIEGWVCLRKEGNLCTTTDARRKWKYQIPAKFLSFPFLGPPVQPRNNCK